MKAIINIDKIFKLCEGIDDKKAYSKQFSDLNERLKSAYGIELPEQIMFYLRDKYHDIINPTILTRIANSLIKKFSDSEIIEILNPSALDNLCAGLDTKAKILVKGNAGSFFASTVASGDYHILGNCGRSLFANATSGRCVVEEVADEGAGYCNQGANILIKGNTRPRTGIQMREGNIITLECLVFNSGLYMAGGNILCLGNEIGKQLGPGMVGGNIYVPHANKENLGINAISRELDSKDIGNIENMLEIFPEHLKTEKISDHEFLIDGKKHDFLRFRKIIAKQD